MFSPAGIGFWTKIFKDNTWESGSDIDIKAGVASWTKGKLDNIKIVILSNGLMRVHLDVPDESDWYQFDRFIVPVSEGTQQSIKTHRAIQAKILPSHIGSCFYAEGFNYNYCFFVSADRIYTDALTNYFSTEITSDMINKWFTVVLPWKKKPYCVIAANRGNIDGDLKQILK